MSATFGVLLGVQFMHAIFLFEAQEVNNPMLQTVHDSKLKWRSYSHWNLITPSWRKILQDCEISLGLRKWCPFAAKFRSPLIVEFLLKLPDICERHFEIFCFGYLMYKSPNSPCNPPIIGFLSLLARTKGVNNLLYIVVIFFIREESGGCSHIIM